VEYQWVTKAESKPYRDLFREAFSYVSSKVTSHTYYYRLIGGAKRNLVLNKPNKGFDFDYQIIFHLCLLNEMNSKELIALKSSFRQAFDEFFTQLGYQYGEDSRSAITIKKLDDEKKIHHSYDITLLSPSAEANDKHIHIMRYSDPEKQVMTWNQMGKSIIFHEKYKQIKSAQKWTELRALYKSKQEKWNGEKKSFSLLMEAVNEIVLI
jgi:hypothetical protein